MQVIHSSTKSNTELLQDSLRSRVENYPTLKQLSARTRRTTPEILHVVQYLAFRYIATMQPMFEYLSPHQFNYFFEGVGKFWGNPLCQKYSSEVLARSLARKSLFSAHSRLCLLPHLETFLLCHCRSQPGDSTVVAIPIRLPRRRNTLMLYLKTRQRYRIQRTGVDDYTVHGLAFPFFLTAPAGHQRPSAIDRFSDAVEPKESVDDLDLVREIRRGDQSHGPLYLILAYDSVDEIWYSVRWMNDGRVRLFYSGVPCHGFELPEISETFKLGDNDEGWREFMTPKKCSCGILGL